MKTEVMEPRLAQLLAETVSAAAGSQLELEQVIACFGLASKLLMDDAVSRGAAKLDPHTAFAKGLAQLADIQPAAYH